jgi:hypothetical protein
VISEQWSVISDQCSVFSGQFIVVSLQCSVSDSNYYYSDSTLRNNNHLRFKSALLIADKNIG